MRPLTDLSNADLEAFQQQVRARYDDSPARQRGNGMINAMRTTMDSAGRIVIPSEIRREAGLQPNTPLDVRWCDGVIEIEPQPIDVKLERRGRLLVARPRSKVATLRADTVQRTRTRLNER